MLDLNILKEVLEVFYFLINYIYCIKFKIDNIIQNNFLMYNQKTNKNESFSEFCHLFCNINKPIWAFYVNGFFFNLF